MVHKQYDYDYSNIVYEMREIMKLAAQKTLSEPDHPSEDYYHAALRIIEVHFMRSVDAFRNLYGNKLEHPPFNDYAAMMLNQENYLAEIPEDTREELVRIFGTKEGIGTSIYYIPVPEKKG